MLVLIPSIGAATNAYSRYSVANPSGVTKFELTSLVANLGVYGTTPTQIPSPDLLDVTDAAVGVDIPSDYTFVGWFTSETDIDAVAQDSFPRADQVTKFVSADAILDHTVIASSCKRCFVGSTTLYTCYARFVPYTPPTPPPVPPTPTPARDATRADRLVFSPSRGGSLVFSASSGYLVAAK